MDTYKGVLFESSVMSSIENATTKEKESRYEVSQVI
jgi:hypothetical protein